ncbi:unnamed protein product, partial [marine sediment metagenome]
YLSQPRERPPYLVSTAHRGGERALVSVGCLCPCFSQISPGIDLVLD